MKSNQKKIAVFGAVLVIVLGNLFRSKAIENVRAVDLLQILATGVCIGAIVVNIVHARKKINSEA
jgi:hypothetical protein